MKKVMKNPAEKVLWIRNKKEAVTRNRLTCGILKAIIVMGFAKKRTNHGVFVNYFSDVSGREGCLLKRARGGMEI